MTEGASPTDDVTTAPAEDPAEGPADNRESDPAGQPTDESAAEPAEEPHDEGAEEAAEEPADLTAALERECDVAADYLEELLDIADLDGDLDLYVEGERAAVSIVGTGLDDLVGRNGEVLDALQELTRLAVLRTTGERSRLMLDIGGFRAAKRRSLEERAREVVAEVEKSGEAQKLSPMTPFERKVVHDAVASAGLKSESEGEEPHRCVVVLPA